MDGLTDQLVHLLTRIGIVDTSLCSSCMTAVSDRERADRAAIYAGATSSTRGRNMWSSLDPSRSRTIPAINGNDATTPPPRTLTAHDNLTSFHGSLAQMDLSDSEARHLFESRLGDRSCLACRGSGRDRRAHFGYSEEAEMHAIGNGVGSGGASAATAFSPQAAPLKALLLAERPLTAILRRKAERAAASRTNSMRDTVGTSTLLIKKPVFASAAVVDLPSVAPSRTRQWLYSYFEELRLPSPSTSSHAFDPLPPLRRLDTDLEMFANLHTLHVSGHRLTVLENLPANIRVVQAYGNRITEVRLKEANASSPTTAAASRVRVKTPLSPLRAIQRSTAGSLVQSGSSPAPPPSLTVSAYPNLLHLGLGFNGLTSIDALLPVAGTLVSLDVSWNSLCDLGATCAVFSAFRRLHTLSTAGNPLALRRVYRAAVLDAFARAAADGSAPMGTLETLDGFGVHTHLLKPPATAATTATANTDETTRSTAGAGTTASAREGSGSSASGRKMSGSGPAAGGSKGAAGKDQAGGARRKKLTAAEAEAEAAAARDAAILALEAARRAEEERRQCATVRPTWDQMQERPTLLLVLQGLVRGLTDPRETFARDFPPPQVEDGKSAARAKKGGEKDGSTTPTGASAAAAAGGATPSKRKKGAPDELPTLADGWMTTETHADALNERGESVHIRTRVRRSERFYFETRLVREDTNATDDEDGTPAPQQREVNHQDGSTRDPDCNSTGARNSGSSRGDARELFRSIEYEWDTLTSPTSTPLPVSPSLAGSPASLHTTGLAYAKEVCFSPSVEWRDLIAHSGIDLLLYRVTREETETETATTVLITPPTQKEATDSGENTPATARSARRRREEAKEEAAAAKKKAAAEAAKGKKGKKGVEAPPSEVQTVVTTSSRELHSLLGFTHVDLSAFLSVHARKNFTSLLVSRNEVAFRRAPGQATGEQAAAAQALPPRDVDPAQWNPQQERRLAVEVPSVAHHASSALSRARESDTRVAFPPLVQPPPSRNEESKESMAAPATGDTDRPSRSRAGRASAGSASEKARLAEEAAAAAAAALARQRADPVYTLGSLAVYLNCRPAAGPGSAAFKTPPPPPSAEEAAAALAAASKKGRKSPALTSPAARDKKAAAAAASPHTPTSAAEDDV